mmetsp:Transcript_80096/g.141818  ORF Transcript_80096/g.141818 Transcript_80096/m.141818 type:complete len:102 (-) Transcript_80096:63-368(-)
MILAGEWHGLRSWKKRHPMAQVISKKKDKVCMLEDLQRQARKRATTAQCLKSRRLHWPGSSKDIHRRTAGAGLLADDMRAADCPAHLVILRRAAVMSGGGT